MWTGVLIGGILGLCIGAAGGFLLYGLVASSTWSGLLQRHDRLIDLTRRFIETTQMYLSDPVLTELRKYARQLLRMEDQ